MATLRALIVGVCDYSAMKQSNLPFVKGLKVDPLNIIVCGNTGSVSGPGKMHLSFVMEGRNAKNAPKMNRAVED
ncbi:hypothetical protein [Paenibacillus jiagnxiensis]|uniref:hypothetical protein n=1 Tax=Paenibacillus jiagnxiensis TaxID=3228926 RepID=UPI0033A954BE